MRTYSCTYFSGTRIICTHVRRYSDNELIQLTYYIDDKDPKQFGAEIYSGQNYIVGSKKASYSRNYKQLKKYPKEYYAVLADLLNQALKVDWESFEGKGKIFEA
jgi:hypothetical protein